MKRITKWEAVPTRELIEHEGDKHHIRHDAEGRNRGETDDVCRSLSRAKRNKAKKAAKSGPGETGSRRTQRHGKKRVRESSGTLDLFGDNRLPEGMKYQRDFLTAEDEERLLINIGTLPFREFEFRGFTGKRRTVSFGWRYDFDGGGLMKTDDMPEFLTDLRSRAEAFAGNAPGSFQQVLVTEYASGAGIGWHKDRSVFGDVVGISLLSACSFRLRRRRDIGFERRNLSAEPRSIYLLRGPSRTEWQHSIPGVESLRYSVTFRNLLEGSIS